MGKLGFLGFIVLTAVILFSFCFSCVPVGHRGVVKTLGKVNHDKVFKEGFNLKLPFLEEVEFVNVKLVKAKIKASASSNDLQDVNTEVEVQFSVGEVSHLFQKIGKYEQVQDVLFLPAIQESVKAVTAKYNAESLITKRGEVKNKIKEEIVSFVKDTLAKKKLPSTTINIANVAITDFSFSHEFNRSIEAKVKAEQEALKAKNEKIKKITDAEAKAEKIRIESVEEAAAIHRKGKALRANPILIKWEYANKWDGKLPTLTGGAVPFIDISKVPKREVRK